MDRRTHRIARSQSYWHTGDDLPSAYDDAECFWFMGGQQVVGTTTLDVSGHGRHMALGATTSAPTKLSDAHGYSFDGGDHMVGSTEPAVTSSGSITLELEFFHDNSTGFQTYIGRGVGGTDATFFMRLDDGAVEFVFRNASNLNWRQWETSAAPITASTRFHVVFRHTFGDSLSTKLTINNSDEAGVWAAGGPDQPRESASWPMVFGSRDANTATQRMVGDIFMGAVWCRYLSDAEITTLYNNSVTRQSDADL